MGFSNGYEHLEHCTMRTIRRASSDASSGKSLGSELLPDEDNFEGIDALRVGRVVVAGGRSF